MYFLSLFLCSCDTSSWCVTRCPTFCHGWQKKQRQHFWPSVLPNPIMCRKSTCTVADCCCSWDGGGGGGQQHKNRDNSDNVSDHLSFLEHSAIPLHLRVERPGVLALARQVPTGLDALEAGEQDLLVVLLVTLLQPRGELLVDLGPLVLKVTQSCSLKWSTDNKQHSNVHWSTLSTTAEKVLFKVSNNQMLCF